VHCYAGLSRSIATVVAFLIADQGIALETALVHVQHCRKGACPENFMDQLRDWEADSGNKDLGSPTSVTATGKKTRISKNVVPPTFVQRTPQVAPL
jgi:hypothetical protein